MWGYKFHFPSYISPKSQSHSQFFVCGSSPSDPNPFFPVKKKKIGKSQLPFYPLRFLALHYDICEVVENQNQKPLYVFSRRQKQKVKEKEILKTSLSSILKSKI